MAYVVQRVLVMKSGDKVTVDMGKRGGVQTGAVGAVFADGSFSWVNRCGFRRTSKLSQVTTEAPRAGVLDPYVALWASEEGDE